MTVYFKAVKLYMATYLIVFREDKQNLAVARGILNASAHIAAKVQFNFCL
jgi:hypothetical protein